MYGIQFIRVPYEPLDKLTNNNENNTSNLSIYAPGETNVFSEEQLKFYEQIANYAQVMKPKYHMCYN
jgi:hypothetical protein